MESVVRCVLFLLDVNGRRKGLLLGQVRKSYSTDALETEGRVRRELRTPPLWTIRLRPSPATSPPHLNPPLLPAKITVNPTGPSKIMALIRLKANVIDRKNVPLLDCSSDEQNWRS